MKVKIFLSVVLSFSLIVLVGGGRALAGDFAGGSGTAGDPYEISNWDHLDSVRDNMSSHFELVSDLDRSTKGYDTYVSGVSGFYPIGMSSPTFFSGSFHGQGHTISDLKIDRPSADYRVGLFYGFDNSNTVVENLTFDNAWIDGSNGCAGILAGIVDGDGVGSIQNVYVKNSVLYGGTDANSGSGGLVGWFKTIDNVISCGVVDSEIYSESGNGSGGLIGESWASIKNCYVVDSVVDSPSDQVGGLVGYQEQGYIHNSYSEGNDLYGENQVGGLVGKAFSCSLKSSYSASHFIDAGADAGGVISSANSMDETDGLYYDNEITWVDNTAVGTGLTTAQAQDISTYSSYTIEYYDKWDGETWYIKDGEDYPRLASQHWTGSGTKDNPIEISRFSQLSLMRTYDGENVYFEIVSDLNGDGQTICSIGHDQTYIGGLYGTLDGNGHVIENFTVTNTTNNTENWVGLFSIINGLVKDVHLRDFTARGNCVVGGFAGGLMSGGALKNCSAVNGTVISEESGLAGMNFPVGSGALIGAMRSGTSSSDRVSIEGCWSKNVSLEFREPNDPDGLMGGLVGRVDGDLKNCYTHALFKDPDNFVDTERGIFFGRASSRSVIDKVWGTLHFVDVDSYDSPWDGMKKLDTTITNCFYDQDNISGVDMTSSMAEGKTTNEMYDVRTYTDLDVDGLSDPYDFKDDPYDDSSQDDVWYTTSTYPRLDQVKTIYDMTLISEWTNDISINVPPPEVSTGSSYDVSGQSVSLDAQLVKSVVDSYVWVEYRKQGDSSWIETSKKRMSSTGTVSFDVSVLVANTDYEYIARAEYVRFPSFTDNGRIRTFSTTENVEGVDLEVTTEGVNDISESSATLLGSVDIDNNLETKIQFAYRKQGTSLWKYTDPVMVYENSEFSETLTDLENNTTYEFRAIGEYTSYNLSDSGVTKTFTTEGVKPKPKKPTSILDLPLVLAGYIGCSEVLAGTILSAVLIISSTVGLIVVIGVVGANVSSGIVFGFVTIPEIGVLVSLGWLPIWIPLLIALLLGGAFGGRIKEYIES